MIDAQVCELVNNAKCCAGTLAYNYTYLSQYGRTKEAALLLCKLKWLVDAIPIVEDYIPVGTLVYSDELVQACGASASVANLSDPIDLNVLTTYTLTAINFNGHPIINDLSNINPAIITPFATYGELITALILVINQLNCGLTASEIPNVTSANMLNCLVVNPITGFPPPYVFTQNFSEINLCSAAGSDANGVTLTFNVAITNDGIGSREINSSLTLADGDTPSCATETQASVNLTLEALSFTDPSLTINNVVYWQAVGVFTVQEIIDAINAVIPQLVVATSAAGGSQIILTWLDGNTLNNSSNWTFQDNLASVSGLFTGGIMDITSCATAQTADMNCLSDPGEVQIENIKARMSELCCGDCGDDKVFPLIPSEEVCEEESVDAELRVPDENDNIELRVPE